MKCPECKSNKIKKSHRRGLERLLRYFLPRAPYRCWDCGNRFWAFKYPLDSLSSKIIVGVIVLLFILPIVLFQGKKEPGPGIRKLIVRKIDYKMREETISEKNVLKRDDRSENTLPIEMKGLRDEDMAVTQKESTEEHEGEKAIKKGISLTLPTIAAKKPEKKTGGLSPMKKAQIEEIEKNHAQPSVSGRKEYKLLRVLMPQVSEGRFSSILLADSPILKYKYFFIGDPPRFVIDIIGKWKNQGYSDLKVEHDKVKGIRVGEHPDKLRVVIDLKGQQLLFPTIKESSKGLILTVE